MDRTIATGDQRLVTLDHGRDLFGLVRVNDENDFIVAHAISLWVNALPHAIRVRQGEKPAIIAAPRIPYKPDHA
jgi:hypothetical protein